MFDAVIAALVTRARAQLAEGGSLYISETLRVREVLDFDPDVLTDSQYPALTFEYAGGSGARPQGGGGSEVLFTVAVSLYTASLTPGQAQRDLRQLMYAGNGKGVMAFLQVFRSGALPELDRVFNFSIGRTRTGYARSPGIGTASAVASTDLTVDSRGRN